jgi:hypothetical protein
MLNAHRELPIREEEWQIDERVDERTSIRSLQELSRHALCRIAAVGHFFHQSRSGDQRNDIETSSDAKSWVPGFFTVAT